MSHTYVLSWDQLGLEACINISDIEKRKVWDTLKSTEDQPWNNGRDPDIGHIVNALMLRARFNHQRHYEIYAIETDDSISTEDMRDMFECDPQGSADLIRVHGRKLYSDRRVPDEQIKIR
jgi:hypothetical protein